MGMAIYQVDAFTDQVFKGNPAGVCLLDEAKDAVWMQAVANEMNLSETAFLLPENDGYRLRWFTPKTEVKLCGHATLASAHVLYEQKLLPIASTAHFYTASGLLTAHYCDDGGLIELDFPATYVVPCEPPAGLVDALGITPIFIGRGDDDYLIEVATEEEVRTASPDFARLLGVACRGVIVTARSTSPDYDFVSRFFAPVVGVNEDPVTGSAHCRLVPYWQGKLGKNEFKAYQASQRGGVLQLIAAETRVRIGGKAVTVLKGELVE
jgi:PhzF family phenazine biosynthesis protein